MEIIFDFIQRLNHWRHGLYIRIENMIVSERYLSKTEHYIKDMWHRAQEFYDAIIFQ